MTIIQTIISIIISTGIVAVFINHLYDKKLKTHEIKLQKYFNLINELAMLVGNTPNYDKLRMCLNEALLFTSDDVVKEILKFNKIFTEKRGNGGCDNFQIEALYLKPLIIAIRKDLYLKSKSILKEDLRFFQIPKKQH